MYVAVLTLLFLFIPVNILALYAGAAIQGRHVPLKKLVLYGTATGTALAIFRELPWPFGVHVIVQTVVVMLVLRFLTAGRWSMVLLGTLLPQLLTAISEGLIAVPVMVGLFEISLAEIFETPGRMIFAGWLGNSLLVVLCAVLYLRQRRHLRMGL